mmetsp:Transcript_38211/g.99234  ORF Transcript_38211/g.99234 Transcript_38211/m.99234 type:complete len:461 (-) Transcript_38211:262-1644(-)
MATESPSPSSKSKAPRCESSPVDRVDLSLIDRPASTSSTHAAACAKSPFMTSRFAPTPRSDSETRGVRRLGELSSVLATASAAAASLATGLEGSTTAGKGECPIIISSASSSASLSSIFGRYSRPTEAWLVRRTTVAPDNSVDSAASLLISSASLGDLDGGLGDTVARFRLLPLPPYRGEVKGDKPGGVALGLLLGVLRGDSSVNAALSLFDSAETNPPPLDFLGLAGGVTLSRRPQTRGDRGGVGPLGVLAVSSSSSDIVGVRPPQSVKFEGAGDTALSPLRRGVLLPPNGRQRLGDAKVSDGCSALMRSDLAGLGCAPFASMSASSLSHAARSVIMLASPRRGLAAELLPALGCLGDTPPAARNSLSHFITRFLYTETASLFVSVGGLSSVSRGTNGCAPACVSASALLFGCTWMFVVWVDSWTAVPPSVPSSCTVAARRRSCSSARILSALLRAFPV